MAGRAEAGRPTPPAAEEALLLEAPEQVAEASPPAVTCRRAGATAAKAAVAAAAAAAVLFAATASDAPRTPNTQSSSSFRGRGVVGLVESGDSCFTHGCVPFVPGRSCQCHPGCRVLGNCCDDYVEQCPVPKSRDSIPHTCALFGCTGGLLRASSSCQCDDDCSRRDDCCLDYVQICTKQDGSNKSGGAAIAGLGEDCGGHGSGRARCGEGLYCKPPSASAAAGSMHACARVACANASHWPQKVGGDCGTCKHEVKFGNFRSCDEYCQSFDHACFWASRVSLDSRSSCPALADKEVTCGEDIAAMDVDSASMLCGCRRARSGLRSHLHGWRSGWAGAKNISRPSVNESGIASDASDDANASNASNSSIDQDAGVASNSSAYVLAFDNLSEASNGSDDSEDSNGSNASNDTSSMGSRPSRAPQAHGGGNANTGCDDISGEYVDEGTNNIIVVSQHVCKLVVQLGPFGNMGSVNGSTVTIKTFSARGDHLENGDIRFSDDGYWTKQASSETSSEEDDGLGDLVD